MTGFEKDHRHVQMHAGFWAIDIRREAKMKKPCAAYQAGCMAFCYGLYAGEQEKSDEAFLDLFQHGSSSRSAQTG